MLSRVSPVALSLLDLKAVTQSTLMVVRFLA